MKYPENAEFSILGILYAFTDGKPEQGDMVIDERDGCAAIMEGYVGVDRVSLRCPYDRAVVEIGVPIASCRRLKMIGEAEVPSLN